MAHYLLAVTPIRAHVLPMVDIGVGLQALGHEVSVLTGREFADAVRSAGLPLVTPVDDVRIDGPPAMPRWVRALPEQARRFWLGRAELDAVFVKPLVAEADALRAALATRRSTPCWPT